MKHGWEYKKFTDVCDVQYGFAFDSKFFTDDENAMPLIRIRDVMRGYSETFYNGEIPNGYLINEGDYLVGMDGEFNIGRWGKRPGLLNQRVCKMSSSSKLLDNQYMYYFMKVCLKSIEDETPFVTVKHLSAKRINLIEIPLPPLLTQQSIASELDKINELIRLKKEQLRDYDNLAQSIFYEMFGDPVENQKGWEERTMQDLCVNIVDCPHSTPKKVDYITDYPCIRTSELRGGSISWATMQYLDEDEYNIRIARLKPEAGDIVFGREGTIGDAVILPLGYNFSLGQRTMLLRADTSIVSNVFLHRTILSDWIKHQIEYVNVSSTVAHVNIKDFKKFTVPLPPLSLQQTFAQRIELIEKQKAEIQTTIADLETLLASRMQYWFD